MAHDAAESVAPTNYYTKVTVSDRGKGGQAVTTREGDRNWTCLVRGIGRKKLAVEMRSQNNTPRCVWVFRRDHVGKVFEAIWRRVYESILFHVPIEVAERRDQVIPDEGVVFGVGCTPTNELPKREGD
jgi:hypothetical protein